MGNRDAEEETCKDSKTENESLCELELSLFDSFICAEKIVQSYKKQEEKGEN